MLSRRDFLKISGMTGAGVWLATRYGSGRRAVAASLDPRLSDPAFQPKFVTSAPNALDPGFRYTPAANGEFTVGAGPTSQMTGLLDPSGTPVPTRLFGYGQNGQYTWPGKTFEVLRGETTTVVHWENNLSGITEHLLPLDTSFHWAYSLDGYGRYTIANTGIPLITHLHGGHTDFQFDGNPEFFFNPGASVVGPQWANVPGGFTNRFVYDNNVRAGTLWYHDHALGITRLNVYAGLAGFYVVRDRDDTGRSDNPLGLPAFPYELAYVVQDRLFRRDGALFYPAMPADPFWAEFITGQGLTDDDVPHPSALAEFFGDHMVVNGVIWPKTVVGPRAYRLRLLNGCDSRFLVIRFRAVPAGATDLTEAGSPIPFYVIGSDQGLAAAATMTDTLVFEPAGRYDLVFDFTNLQGRRILMENIGGDGPFAGDFGDALEPDALFPDRQTNRIMAFDVLETPNIDAAFRPSAIQAGPQVGPADAPVRQVALFEGRDEYGRLQPLLGTAAPTVDATGGRVNGALAWHSPSTENPRLDTTEIWEIYNATGDAHPVHLHLVNFAVMNRQAFVADVIEQPLRQHTGTMGVGFRLENVQLGDMLEQPVGYVENAPKDTVTALPGQVTRIRATFDKPGRYVWHCHILSHEDHEMMRVLDVR